MAVTCDPEHKFELALQLGDLKVAYQIAKEAEVGICTYIHFTISGSNQKWNTFRDVIDIH